MNDESNVQKIDLNKVDWRGSREFFESLGEELDKLDDKDETYDFTWVGKRKSIIEAGAPINKTFRPNVEASKNWDTTENLFIEGDNLDALKLLQESYLGKVKMIYIDPPYNTGKDTVYHDNFKANVKDYDESTEYKDESGNIQFKKNEKSNGRYHSDWLSMMYPRLKLARNLLMDDGIIAISIDHHELTNLQKLLYEIFSEDNQLGLVAVINNLKGRSDDEFFATSHEYLLVFAKNSQNITIAGIDLDDEELSDDYEKQDEFGFYKPIGFRKTGKGWERHHRPYMFYPILYKDLEFSTFTYEENTNLYNKNTNSFNDGLLDELIRKYESDGFRVFIPKDSDGNYGRWRWGLGTFQKNKDTELILNEAQTVCTKMRATLENGELRTKTAKTFWYKPTYDTGGSGTRLNQLFETRTSYFDNPKSVYLIKDLLKISTSNIDLILDFFSGSGTTAHAVMQLNAEDGDNRKWIMVQLPEETNEKSEAFKAGYKTIPEISRERIRRAGDKIAAEYPEAKVDYGFRALTISDTNYKDVYKSANDITQLSLGNTVDNIKENRSDLDLLYGVLTATALELNRPFEERNISGSKVYLYDYFSAVSGLIACFSESISEDTIKEIAKLKPITAVFRESSFPDSQAKVNLSEHFRILSPDTKVKVI